MHCFPLDLNVRQCFFVLLPRLLKSYDLSCIFVQKQTLKGGLTEKKRGGKNVIIKFRSTP